MRFMKHCNGSPLCRPCSAQGDMKKLVEFEKETTEPTQEKGMLVIWVA